MALERTVLELHGIPCLALEEETPDRKSVTVSRSFGRVMGTLPELPEATATYTARAAEKMRRQGLVTARLTVFAYTSCFCAADERATLCGANRHTARATVDSVKLVSAGRALASVFRTGYRYAKASYSLIYKLPRRAFRPAGRCARHGADARVDGLNRRYGRYTVSYAATGTHCA